MAPQGTTDFPKNPPTEDPSIGFGKHMSSPPPGEEVVISGLSGKFPDSEDVYEFRDNLFNKKDMVNGDKRRWKTNHPEIPQRTGKLKNIDLFDAGYFGIHHRQATSMDPMGRLLLERVIECIFDAGVHPSELEGTNTGVFVGSCFSENEKTWFFDKLHSQTFAVSGGERSMLPHRVSYFLKLEGPSFVCDTACSSSLYALEHAYKALRSGQCDRAIVAGTNICLHPFVSLQFYRLGVLSLDGICRVFDAEGTGYVRSEAVGAILLQKSKEARRIYSTIVHAKTNCDGYKDSGITFPSREMQIKLLKEFYEECKVDPNDLTFLEAHGTGTKVGDPEECQAIEEVFVKERNRPLLIGSVKSNIGHTEPSSGVCSITKAIIAMETGYIPPNINYKSPRKGIKALEDGRLIVVTEKTRLPDNKGLIGINSFGFGGGNCHMLLKWNPKEKTNQGQPSDKIPRLICVSGRTEEAVNTLLDDIPTNNGDNEHIRLIHEVFSKNIRGHAYRGFSVVTESKEIARSVICFKNKIPLYVALSELTAGDMSHLIVNSSFKDTLKQIHKVLATKNINIYEIVFSNKITSTFHKLIATLTVQLCVIEVLRNLELEVTDVFGVSFFELVSLYWRGDLSIDETVECAYVMAAAEKSLYKTSWLYVVLPDEKELHQFLPKDVEVVTNISRNAAIVAGAVESIASFRELLEQNNALHYYLGSLLNFKQESFEQNRPYLSQQLSEIMSSTEKCNGRSGIFSFLSDLTQISPLMKFVETLSKEAIVMEIGEGIFKNVLQVIRKEVRCVTTKDFDTFLLNLGSLYELGHNPQLHKLYPKVKFPVSRGTPMISPKIKWNHHQKWWVSSYNTTEQYEIGERTAGIMLKDPTYTFVGGHVIDGRNLFPATGYLELVWETLAQIKGLMISDMQVIFENCKFKRACSVPKEGSKLELTVMVQRGSGNFEVVEGDVPVVTGRVYEVHDMEKNRALLPLPSEVPEDVAKPMTSKDVYKELRLRGYNYKGGFRAITNCDSSCQVGKVKWDGNWITFIDNMLQMKILQEDTRLLYVPTSIKRLSIDAKKHISYANIFGEDTAIPVYAYRDIGVIRSGGIEICGLVASSIQRRKYLGTPVLEKYEFVPNIGRMSKEQSIRVQIQIALENAYGIKIKVVELIDEATPEDSEPLAPLIKEVLEDQPLIQPDILILSKKPLSIKTVPVEDRKLLTETDCMLVIGSQLLQRIPILKLALGSLKEGGFIISRELLNIGVTNNNQEIEILTMHELGDENIVLLRKKSANTPLTVIKASSTDKQFKWLPKLQSAVKNDLNVIVYSQNEPLSGILGLVNCIRREPGSQNTKCVFIVDEAPAFDPGHPFYVEQLRKNMAINVYKYGQWGTYRHLLLENLEEVEVEHCYVNSMLRGDLSSLKWIEGPLGHKSHIDPETKMINIYYSAVNFRDVMTASGKINVDVITRDRREQECVQGFEFSGRTENGKRVMGLATHAAIATMLLSDSYLLWEIPDSWSLEDAATVPVVYATSLYALVKKGRVRNGDTVLIHSGTGGVGQAAIALALYFGCTVFTTVGTPEKKEFIKEIFPQLTDSNIANSRDTSFEGHIMRETNGRGVDIVINSLAEEKLLASVRCLARGGRFVEIGKYDLGQDNPLSLLLFQKEATFHGFMLDSLFQENPTTKLEMNKFLTEAIEKGAIKPLQRKVFNMDEVEAAFRYMTTGKHTGKVLIRVREEELEKTIFPSPKTFKGMPRYFCDHSKTYVIIGGLGGFGLELADWLVLRGARNLVLTSRSGIKTGYQEYRIGIWRSYGCTVQISTRNVTTKEGCYDLIKDAGKLGPIHAIFNLAVVLSDSIFENQSEESYKTAFAPKAYATEYLDEVTRVLCPELRDFVVFSSVSCGRGNAGQTNYGMANSVMERICEKRKVEGYPALAVEWGAVGDVGLVAEMQEEYAERDIGGTLQQRITSCLSILDKFLRQKDVSIVSSMVVAEKRHGSGGADNIIDAVANILGVKDLRDISMHATLAEIGMDSMTAVEIKQTLEREFEVLLTSQDIKSMTFARLYEIQAEKNQDAHEVVKKEKALVGMNMVVRMMGDAETANIPLIKLQNKAGSTIKSKVLLFPGIEGVATCLDSLAVNLEGELFGLQFCNHNQAETIEGMASTVLPYVVKSLSKSQPFTIVGYSFGGVVALEVVHLLEQQGYYGTYVCIDGAPALLKKLTNVLEVESEDKFQTTLIVHLMAMHISYDVIVQHTEALFKCSSLEERIKLGQKVVGYSPKHTPEHQRDCAISVYKRLKALVAYQPDFRIKSNVKLIKPRYTSIELESEDYQLSELCDNVEVAMFDGNHVTILDNPEVASTINSYLLTTDDIVYKESIVSNIELETQEIKGM